MPFATSALARAAAWCIVIVLAAVSFAAPPAVAAPSLDRPYHPELALVSFVQGTTANQRAAVHASLGGVVVNRLDAAGIDVVRVPAGVDPAVAADRYQRDIRVASAQPNYEMRIASVPNDALFGQEWGLHNTSQLVAGSLAARGADFDVDAPEGWDIAFGPGSFPSTGGTRVGVLDTGIDRGHADLLNKVKACASAVTALGIVATGACEDDNSHGTHVAGTIAAAAHNTLGVAGVAPNAELAIFKGLNAGGVGFYADIIAGIHWLHSQGQARIISMSLTGPQDAALDAELSEAAAAGVLLVAAAGNQGDATANWPAHHPGVMSIGSVNQSGGRSSFSNCTTDVEVAAPGEDVWSTAPGNGYVILSGTSMATPHVSGVAAMVMWKKGFSATQTRTTLRTATEDSGGCNGVGIVNLRAALA